MSDANTAHDATDTADDLEWDESAEPKESLFRRRPWLGPALIVLALGALIYGAVKLYDYRTHGRYVQSTNDATVAADDVTISSKLAGYVRAVPVAENQNVSGGQLLVEVDPTDYETRVAQADAQIDSAQASENATQANIREAQAGVGQATAALAVSQRELTYLDGEIARYRPLVASGAEPKTALSQLLSNRDKTAADVAAKQANVRASQSRINSIRAQGGQAVAQIQSAKVQRRAAQYDLNSTRLTAPIGGKVGNSTVRVGQFVQPGQRLMTIVPVGDLYVDANFKETQIGLMRPGQPVVIRADALPGVEFHGVVQSITPGTGANFSLVPPQNATGNFTKIVQRVPVRIKINAGPESRQVLVPGLSLDVEVDTSSAKGALKAIKKEQDGAAK